MALDSMTLADATETGLVLPWEPASSVRNVELLGAANTAEEMSKAAGIDWTVSERNVYTTNRRGQRTPAIPNVKAIVRDDTDTVLSIMSKRYARIQNAQLADLAKALVDDGDLRFESAGSFSGGKIVWMLGRLPEDIVIPGDPSPIRPFIFSYTSHDGSKPWGTKLTKVRIRCRNTFNAAVGDANPTYFVKHTPGALHMTPEQAAQEARNVMGVSLRYTTTVTQFLTDLATRPMTISDFEAFTEEFLPTPPEAEKPWKTERDREELRAVFANSELLDGVAFTNYRALNAVTEFVDHHRNYLKTAGNSAADNRALSLLDGQGARMKAKAVALLTN